MTLGLLAATPVFVDAEAAAARIEAGATVIDARGSFAKAPYLPGARVVDWMRLRDGLARTGRLADEAALRRALARAGVEAERPVLVYGAADDGWGEEGRIWWTLRYLGHPDVQILDGGVKSWLRAGHETQPAPSRHRRARKNRKGRLRSKTVPRLRAKSREVLEARPRKDVVVLDVRTAEEYGGATPYLSKRGGHVPGAGHLEWRELLRDDGRLKPEATLRARLAAAGLSEGQRVIAYCTGGVRSGFVVAVLAHLGFDDVANYDGSWWDWAEQDSLPVAR